jgi:hypothetical protein
MPQFGGGAPGGLDPGSAGGPPGMMGGMGMAMPANQPRNEHEVHAQALIQLIVTNVEPDSWSEMGGPGSISAYHGLIVATQTAQVHKKIERVLDMLREAGGLEVGAKKVVR